MPNLLDIMTDDDRQSATKLAHKHSNGQLSSKVNPMVYQVAKLGYYYGWGAIEAVKRGYVDKDGEKIMLTMEEVSELVKAADKIWAQKCIDLTHCSQIGTSSAMSEHPKQVFEKAIKPFEKMAAI